VNVKCGFGSRVFLTLWTTATRSNTVASFEQKMSSKVLNSTFYRAGRSTSVGVACRVDASEELRSASVDLCALAAGRTVRVLHSELVSFVVSAAPASRQRRQPAAAHRPRRALVLPRQRDASAPARLRLRPALLLDTRAVDQGLF